jgi:putative ABC transport system permease protein
VIRALDRKLLRDLWRLKWQVLAIAMLIACGVAVGVMAGSTQISMEQARDDYYRQTEFADVFVSLKRAPLAVADRLAEIPGVADVDPRAIKAGLMEVAGQARPATVQLISLPDPGRRGLNRLVITAGREPSPDRADEAIALKTFLDAAHIPLGQTVAMVVDGRQIQLRIVGAALSPEFVFVPAAESGLPDEAHQAVLWAPRRSIDRALGLGDAFSSVSMKLAPGASLPSVLQATDAILKPYGASPSIGRVDQVSDKFQEERIQRLGVMSAIVPPIFLVVAAALINLILGRLVESERDQIGLFKAFGYSDLAAAQIYLKMALIVALIGDAAGGVLGLWLGDAVTAEIGQYLRFPHLEARFAWMTFLFAAGVSLASAVGGAAGAVRRAVRVSPAVAMRPPAPTAFRRGALEALPIWPLLDQPTRMIVRSLERFPVRAILTVCGLAVSLSLLVGSRFLFDSLDVLVDKVFFESQRWSDAVAFAEPRDVHAIAETRRLPGVLAAEPTRGAPADFRLGRHLEKAAVTGLEPGARLSHPLAADGAPIPFKGRGLVLSHALAARLNAKVGDVLGVEITEGRHPTADLPVTAISDDFFGALAYMDRRQLNRLIGEGDLATGAQLTVDQNQRRRFYASIAAIPMIAGASSRQDALDSWNQSVSQTLDVEMVFFLGFASAIGFGVAYNLARTALADRSRDLATLRVLGFAPSDCVYILLGELSILTLAAVPLGLLGGIGMAKGLAASLSREDFRLPSNVPAISLGVGLVIYFATVAIAAVPVARRIGQLDMVAVLKTRD